MVRFGERGDKLAIYFYQEETLVSISITGNECEIRSTGLHHYRLSVDIQAYQNIRFICRVSAVEYCGELAKILGVGLVV
jgi:hypothetical protein